MVFLIDEWGMGNESGGSYTNFCEMLLFGMRCNDDCKTTNVCAISNAVSPQIVSHDYDMVVPSCLVNEQWASTSERVRDHTSSHPRICQSYGFDECRQIGNVVLIMIIWVIFAIIDFQSVKM
jgi:hypothetical protein